MSHKASTTVLDGTVTLSAAQTTQASAITTALSAFDTAYDALDPDDVDFQDSVDALIATRDTALAAALAAYDAKFLSNQVSLIAAENPDRLGLWVFNESNDKFYLFDDSVSIAAYEASLTSLRATRNTAFDLVFTTYDTAVAALDPDDVDYATDLAALRTTRGTDYASALSTYHTAQALADNTLAAKRFTYVSASGGRWEMPGQGAFDGPVYGVFVAANGTCEINETSRR